MKKLRSKLFLLQIVVSILSAPCPGADDLCAGLRQQQKHISYSMELKLKEISKTGVFDSRNSALWKEYHTLEKELAQVIKQIELCEKNDRRLRDRGGAQSGNTISKKEGISPGTPIKPNYIQRDDRRNIQYSEKEREQQRQQQSQDVREQRNYKDLSRLAGVWTWRPLLRAGSHTTTTLYLSGRKTGNYYITHLTYNLPSGMKFTGDFSYLNDMGIRSYVATWRSEITQIRVSGDTLEIQDESGRLIECSPSAVRRAWQAITPPGSTIWTKDLREMNRAQ